MGTLHLEIIKERIETEYNVNVINALPSVRYYVYLKNKKKLIIDIPSKFPDFNLIDYIEEPYCKLTIITPEKYYGIILEFTIKKRGIFIDSDIIENDLYIINFNIPYAEIIYEYFSKIKLLSKGYASMDYSLTDYRKSDLLCLNIKLNNQIIEPLSMIVHKKNAYKEGKWLCENLKYLIPKHSFEVPVQAVINNKVISRETIKGTRKDVTAKLYGGDVSRKKKLLSKQKKGKKRMKQFGKVSVPQNIFIKLIKLSVEK